MYQRALLEFIGTYDITEYRSQDDTTPLRDVLGNKPPVRDIETVEVSQVFGNGCIEVVDRGAKKILSQYDGPLWVEALDDEGHRVAFYVLRFIRSITTPLVMN